MLVHLLLDGFADGAFGAAANVIATAGHLAGAGADTAGGARRALAQRVVSLDGAEVRSLAGRPTPVDGAFAQRKLRAGDVVLVPGIFAARTRTVPELLRRPDVQRTAQILGELAARGITIAASCSATFVLATSGALDGRTATTSWWLAPEFARRFPAVTLTSERVVVDEGHILTAGAALAHADLVLAVLARLVGPALPGLVARYLLLDARSSQAPYVVLDRLRPSDPGILALERFVRANLERQLTLAELARAAGTSPRTLARRVHASLGMTPQALVQRLRVDRAVQLLETTRRSVDEIAAAVGYADAAAFRRVFRRLAGDSPARVRAEA